MTMSKPITEMNSIDWQHLVDLEILVVSEAIAACGRMHCMQSWISTVIGMMR